MHHCIALSFLSALAPRCNGNVRLGPWNALMSQLYLCSTRAERHLKSSHSHLKPSTKSLKKPRSLDNPCWGCFESGSCSSSVGLLVWVAADITPVALWPLILGHVPRNQLELRTCIPCCCGDDYQGCRKLKTFVSKCGACFVQLWKKWLFLLTINSSCKAEKTSRWRKWRSTLVSLPFIKYEAITRYTAIVFMLMETLPLSEPEQSSKKCLHPSSINDNNVDHVWPIK